MVSMVVVLDGGSAFACRDFLAAHGMGGSGDGTCSVMVPDAHTKKEKKTATSMDRRCQMVANAPAIGAVGVSAIHGPCDGLAYV